MKLKHYFMNLLGILLFSIGSLMGAPVITIIETFEGPSIGGTVISIQGSGFAGTTAVDFGLTPAASFVVNSDTLITATTPPHSPETVFVTVTTADGPSTQTHQSYFVFKGAWEVYIGNRNSHNVTNIHTLTDTFTTIQTNGIAPSDIAMTPNGTKALVSNRPSSNNVNAIDTATNTFVNIPSVNMTGTQPYAVAILPDGKKAYVANFGTGDVSVIDIITNTHIATVPTGLGTGKIALTATPDGQKVYVSNLLFNNVTVIDTKTDTVIKTISVGVRPLAIAITPDGTKAYVTNQLDNNISVIDIATDTVISTISVGENPSSLAIAPDGKNIYVVNQTSDDISVIDTITDTLITTVSSGGTSPSAIMITPDGTKVYIANETSNSISVIDASTHTLITTIAAIGDLPIGLQITPDGKKVYVINFNSNNVAIINTADDTFTSIPTIGDGPTTIAITPDQAPLARFIAKQIPPSNFDFQFDASGSTSPVGTIVNYFWDFGDGITLNTILPVVNHTYATFNNYPVTLIVTNSAGTSTRQIWNPSTTPSITINGSIAFIQGTSSVTFTHNGGPSAQTTQIASILPITNEEPSAQPTPIEPILPVTNEDPSGQPTQTTPIIPIIIEDPSAQIPRLPVIRSITHADAKIDENEKIRISGFFFTGTTAVLFGSQPALSFEVISDQLIVAIVPPNLNQENVNIRIVGAGGATSLVTSACRFNSLRPLPPKLVNGYQTVRGRGSCRKPINILTWEAPSCPSSTPMTYRIYRNKNMKKIAGEVKANCGNQVKFVDYDAKKGSLPTYFIVSVDQLGNPSQPVEVVIRSEPNKNLKEKATLKR